MTRSKNASSEKARWWCCLASLLVAMYGGGAGVRAELFTLGYITGSQRLPGDYNYQRPGLVISGAMSLAVEDVNRELLGPLNHQLNFTIAETYGQEEYSIRQVAELWVANVSGYIGPQETCEHEGRMAAAFNLPMISYYCRDMACSDKRVFPTFARTRPPDAAISHSVVAVLTHFRFMHVTFVYLKAPNDDFSRLAEAIIDEARKQNIVIRGTHEYSEPYYHNNYSADDTNPFVQIVQSTYKDTRVYVSVGNYHDHIGLMLALDSLQLLDKGEYVAVGVDVEQYSPEKQYLKPPVRQQPDTRTPLAFRSYLAVAPSSPAADFTTFAQNVNQRLKSPPFNFKNVVANVVLALGVGKQIPAEAAWLYDAVWRYACALVEQLQAGEDPRDGRAIAKRMRGTTYNSAMGYQVRMDSNGDVVGNYTLLALDPDRPAGLYPLATLLQVPFSPLPILNFERQMHWVGGQPPLSEPPCGFRGEKCINHIGEIGAGVAGGALALLVLAALALYRGWRYEQELDSLLWKIDYRDVRLARAVRPDRDPPPPPSSPPSGIPLTTAQNGVVQAAIRPCAPAKCR